MRPTDVQTYNLIKGKLISFHTTVIPLRGLNLPGYLDCFTQQIIDSVRRIKYVEIISTKALGEKFTNPTEDIFDPLKAASWHHQHGNVEESFWLVFLATHFGKNKTSGWELLRQVYLGDINSGFWTWDAVIHDFNGFRQWLHNNQAFLRSCGSFGNHRKYQSLDAFKPSGTGMAIGSYIEWVKSGHDHNSLYLSAVQQSNNNPKSTFDFLYRSMQSVISFGRMGRFDYLTMVGKLGLAPLEPGSTYMHGSTGPKTGAWLLFEGTTEGTSNEKQLETCLNSLETHLGLSFGMQVLEDALCNWQKSPNEFIHFSG